MRFSIVASGSSGNCCVIEENQQSIIIDCGCTQRYLKQSFQEIGFQFEQAQGILITHTHSDHINAINLFKNIKKYAPVVMNVPKFNLIAYYDEFELSGFKITVLPLSHDCDHTVGYIIEGKEEKLVYITDTGYVSEDVKTKIKDATYYIFESNHDVEMLMQTSRPITLKQRIIGDNGHLCNEDCAKILAESIGKNTKEIVLAHISREGNTRKLAFEVVSNYLKQQNKWHEQLQLFSAGQFEIYQGGKMHG